MEELRVLCESEETGIKRWLPAAYGDAARRAWYEDEDELLKRLEREHLRSG